MKVLHISTDDCTGAGLCCLRIHLSLLNMGIESKVLTLRNTQHVKGEYGYGFLRRKLSILPSKILRLMGLTITEYNRIKKLSIANNHAPYDLPVSAVNLLQNEWVAWADIIHLHWVCNILDFPSFFQSIKKPVVWTLHDEYFFYGIAHYSKNLLENNEMERHYTQMKREALSKVDSLSIVMLSDFFYQKFHDNELLKGRRVRVINNPVDTSLFTPTSKYDARRNYGLNKDDIVFGFTAVNIAEERKGLNVLSQVLEDIDNYHLKILAIGDNPLNRKWPNVISVGQMKSATELSQALSACDFFAMPSYQEAFAQSPMEAMACGLPVVAFPVSGTSELINERNGIVCDDFSPEALRKGIEMLMTRNYVSSDIRQDMIDRFSPEVIASEYVSLYLSITTKT